MSTDLKKRMLKLLEDTANHYNSSNRSMVDGDCSYLPEEGSCSEGCAIGRLLPEEYKKHARRLNTRSVDYLWFYFGQQRIHIPEVFRDIDLDFLTQLQNLHDGYEFWDEEGLTEEGKVVTDRIKREFRLY